MKAPDKIYARIVANKLYASREPHKIFNEPLPEYIRKEALLEWAKMKKDHIKIVDWDADYYFGLDFMLDELIDKLNEM